MGQSYIVVPADAEIKNAKNPRNHTFYSDAVWELKWAFLKLCNGRNSQDCATALRLARESLGGHSTVQIKEFPV